MMEELNKNTVEAWLLDYIEGNLNSDQRVLLELFLAQNPEYASMLEDYEEITLKPEAVSFEKKENIKHSEYEYISSFDTKCIEYHEGLLSKKDQIDFENELANNEEKRQTALLFGKTKLIPDFSIQFYNKKKLKKNEIGKRIILYMSYAAAASIIFTTGMFVFQHYNSQSRINTLATTKQTVQPKKIVEEVQIPEEILAKEVPVRLASSKKATSATAKTQVTKPLTVQSEKSNNTIDPEDVELASYHGISVIQSIQPENINTGNEMVAITSIQSVRVIKNIEDESQSPFMEKELNSLLAGARNSLQSEQNLTAYEWAKRFIKGVKKYTGAEVKLSHKVDANGNKEEIAFDSRFFGIERSSSK